MPLYKPEAFSSELEHHLQYLADSGGQLVSELHKAMNDNAILTPVILRTFSMVSN